MRKAVALLSFAVSLAGFGGLAVVWTWAAAASGGIVTFLQAMEREGDWQIVAASAGIVVASTVALFVGIHLMRSRPPA